MKKFIKKWNGRTIEDWGIYCSDEFKEFTRNFKSALKREMPDCNLIGFKSGHYDFSGFVEKDEKYVYISFSYNRWSPLDLCRSDWETGVYGVLYRTAKDAEDWTGGMNHFSDFTSLTQNVYRLLEE